MHTQASIFLYLFLCIYFTHPRWYFYLWPSTTVLILLPSSFVTSYSNSKKSGLHYLWYSYLLYSCIQVNYFQNSLWICMWETNSHTRLQCLCTVLFIVSAEYGKCCSPKLLKVGSFLLVFFHMALRFTCNTVRAICHHLYTVLRPNS